MNKKVILSSGGMDSYLAWYLTGKSALNIFVDIGQNYLQKERVAIQLLASLEPEFKYEITMAADLGSTELPSGIIPNRNAHLILAAAAHGTDILMGVLKDEINSDKSKEFMTLMGKMLSEANKGQYWNDNEGIFYSVYSPIRHLTKSEAVELYLIQGGSPEILLTTVSCYHPTSKQCGACPSCFKRWIAVVNNDLEEDYDNDPVQYAVDNGIVAKCFDGTYPPDRAKEIYNGLQHTKLKSL